MPILQDSLTKIDKISQAKIEALTQPGIDSLANPHGFSGSLLWNTKLVEAIQSNVEWNPSMSEVTGVIWAWPSSAVSILRID
jgi:hypothetical protein